MATLTVGDLTPRAQYTASSSQTVFSYAFPIFADTDLKVYVGSTLKTLTTDYTVTGAATTAGGTVVFGSGLTAGDIVTIYRDLPIARTTDYATGGALLAENLNDDLDKLVMMAQQNESGLVRKIGLQLEDEDATMELPVKATRSTKILGFDSDGDVAISGSTMSEIDATVGAAFAGGVLATSYQFTGDGSAVAFTVTGGVTDIPNAQSLIITVDGITQHTDTYTTSGAVVTFSVAPPNNSDIQVRYNAYAGTATDAAGITYSQGGTGASSRTIENKLQESVSVKDFGAVGDGTTDDTTAIQAAVDYCLTNEKDLLIDGSCKLTAPITIDRSIDTTFRQNEFRIKGLGSNSGFIASTAIIMFSATAAHTTTAVSDCVGFENIQFEVADSATNAYVTDGAFIRMRFNTCRFMKIKCMSTSGVNTFSYWFDSCQMYGWAGTFFSLQYTSANDISFVGCYVNGGEDFIDLAHTQAFRFIDNTVETCTGTPIEMNGARGAQITGNYFESNSTTTGSYYVDLGGSESMPIAGAHASGNLFYLTDTQVNNASFYAINWYGTNGAVSTGNWSTGKLHRIATAELGGFISKGDVDNQTNDDTKSEIKAIYPIQGSQLKLVQSATSKAITPYNINTDKVTKTYTADLFSAAGTTDSEIVWEQPAQSLLIAVSMVLDEQFVAPSLTDLNVLVGDASDNNGVLQEAMNLSADAVASRLRGRGVYWDGSTGVTELYKSTAYEWTAYATATGANLDTLTAGSVTFYFTYRSL